MAEQLDQAKIEKFASTMMGILNGGMLSLVTSIGYHVGIFEAMAGKRPSTADEIAKAAGLNPRYVREWLDTMVTGRIVEYLPAENSYFLPPEHAALMTRAAGPDNMAVFAGTIPWLAKLEGEYVECFRKGGGVAYERFDEFLALWSGFTTQRFDRTLISKVLPLMPVVVQALQRGIDVLDIGCGAGHSTNLMAQAYPGSRFTGYDFRDPTLDEGRSEAKVLGLTNVRFVRQDLAGMDDVDAYDLISAFDVIHDQAHPSLVVNNVMRALKPGGTFLMVDIRASSCVHENLDHPMGPFLYATSTLHCMTVSLALGGEGLGTMWGEQRALELLHHAGFTDVAVRQIEGDIFNNYYIAQKAH
ncbi:MAG: methyltransferase domain-containing protein [Acidobacteriales bacterium]|nr:methyltransferase domain-containing protein [Terriglobales bacterium]